MRQYKDSSVMDARFYALGGAPFTPSRLCKRAGRVMQMRLLAGSSILMAKAAKAASESLTG